jgi:GNAT superfamily N-acetyltransferase
VSSLPIDEDTLRHIELAAVRAWPALEVADFGGWLWRYSRGGSRRANSVATLEFAGEDIDAAIDAMEARYRDVGAPCQFQITDVSEPTGLDAHLAARGYCRESPSTTLVRRLSDDDTAPDGFEMADHHSPEWFEVYSGVLSEDRRRVAPEILPYIPEPRSFCGVRQNGRLSSTAVCVLSRDIAIVEAIATRADVRRQRCAMALLAGVAAWAYDEGAKLLALQVVADNAPAQQLYRRLGFRHVGGYHYRVKS